MTPSTATLSVRLSIEGMTCAGCVRSVQRKLESVPGVRKASVSLESSSAAVEYDAGKVQPEALAAAVRAIGFEAQAR